MPRDAYLQYADDAGEDDNRSFQDVLEAGVGRKEMEDALAFANTKLSPADKEEFLRLLKQ